MQRLFLVHAVKHTNWGASSGTRGPLQHGEITFFGCIGNINCVRPAADTMSIQETVAG